MLDSEFYLAGPPDTYDNTMLSQFCKCPRSFYWFMRRLDLRYPPPYFSWGRAWGVAMNTWHHSQGSALDALERTQLALYEAKIEWDKDAPIPDKNNSFEVLQARLEQYVMVYGDEEPWHCAYPEGELGFRFPIESNTEIYYAGSIDDPIEWQGYGLLFREDKSTGGYINTQGVDPIIKQWDFSTQVAGYAWAFAQLLGEPPAGAYMNMVSKSNRKDFELNFCRYFVTFSDWDLRRFMKDTITVIDDIIREWDRWQWPALGRRDPINCVGGMGRTACIYRGLCQSGMEPWDMEEQYSFSEDYVWRGPWAPWEREGGNE